MPALINCAVIRTELPALRTEPSSTCATCSVRAISGMPVSLPLKANDEVRAVTCSCGIFASRFSSSSEMPSEKYPWSLACDMSTNGNTAMLFSEITATVAASLAAGIRSVINRGRKNWNAAIPPAATATAMVIPISFRPVW